MGARNYRIEIPGQDKIDFSLLGRVRRTDARVTHDSDSWIKITIQPLNPVLRSRGTDELKWK